MSSPEDRERRKRRLERKELNKYEKRSEAPVEQYKRINVDPRKVYEYYDEE